MIEAADSGSVGSCSGERVAQRPELLQDDLGLIAPRRQLIDLDGGRRRQLPPLDDADALQTFEPLRQDVRADAGQARSQIGEAPPAEHQLTHDQQRPAFADEFEGQRRAAGVVIPAFFRAFRLSYFL